MNPNEKTFPLFPSLGWCRTLVDAIHANPQSAVAGKGWRGSLAVAVLPDACLSTPFIAYSRIEDGRVLELRELDDLDEIEELAPDYVARATYWVWKKFILGEFDPIQALLQRKIVFLGDVQPIIERAQFKALFWSTLAQIPRAFIDEA